MLEESFYNTGNNSHDDELKSAAYKKQIRSLEKQINIYKNKIIEKDESINKLQEKLSKVQ